MQHSLRTGVCSCLFAVFTCVAGSAYGDLDAAMIKRYFTISEASIEEISADEPDSLLESESVEPEYISPDVIINLGKTIWAIIEAGKPVLDVKTDFASALPEGVPNWQALTEWQTPKSKSYRIKYKNGLGITAVRIKYRLMFAYGGRYRGIGQYLTNVAIIPSKIKVIWGYKLNASIQVPQILNVGTKESPLAGIQLLLHWKIDSIFSKQEGSNGHYVRGDGYFTKSSDLHLNIAPGILN